MATGTFTTAASADEKKTDYQAYAAELDKSAYSGNDLGAVYTEKSTTFKVWSPKASAVSVDIYDYGSEAEGGESIRTTNMTLDKKTGVWSATISGDLAGKYYDYAVTHGEETKRTADIYARACGVNGKRSMVVDLRKTDPDNWENDLHVMVDKPTNASVWEISVADFSSSETSGVSKSNRGKFLAFTESGTTVDGIQGGTPTCMDYLKKLGVKYVQIMPMYDFGSVDESKDIMKQFNWGYDPVNYNVPEGSFSTDPYNGAVRIKECKQMIQALHNAGIGVIMDVVYNHTYSTDSWFQYTVPNYYYRMNEDGTFSNGSGCSNDTASEHLMFRKYMIDSVTYWAKEYHIDGFRFDLMGLHDVTTMNDIRAALDGLYEDGSGKKILMYGEAWNMPTKADEGTVMANQQNLTQMDDRIGAFDDTIRDAIKGSTAGADKGFVQSGGKRSDLKTGFLGQSNLGWANVPSQCVTYASCHDNLCLYDKLVDSVYGSSEYRKRHEDLVLMNKLSAAIVMTAQGIPFFLGGEEFCRSKDGDENSFSSSREENMLDWKNVESFSDVVEYYRGLLKIRDSFAAFMDCTAMTANHITSVEDLPKGVAGFYIPNTEQGKWSKICTVFNGTGEDKNIAVEGEWIRIADENVAGLNNLGTCSGSVNVKAHSAAIMVDKQSYESAGISDYEGAVVMHIYDDKTKELLGTQVVTDSLGSVFDVNKLTERYNYDVKSVKGEKTGRYEEKPRYIDVYVTPYTGKTANVTIRFVDDINGAELADAYSIRNRPGQKYRTPDLPEIENYTLVLGDLPKNGAGELGDRDVTVTYKYTRITDDTDRSICKVNVIYMDDGGQVIETQTLTGKEGEVYHIQQNEYEEKTLIEVPPQITGSFKKGEINVILTYNNKPDPLKQAMVWVFVGVGVIFALCIASAILSHNKRKKKLQAAMDFTDALEPDKQ
ncbi:MAG: type I pullulanase [Ruminococcus sp.]|nr:type I pullulanase [Ruminococcus sp.]